MTDNPELNNRFYPTRPSPLRIALDLNQRIPSNHHLLSDSSPTLILGETRSDKTYLQTTFLNTTSASWIQDMLDYLKQTGITSLLVEGGANTHQQFIDAGVFDEIRRIRNNGLYLKTGIHSAVLPPSQTRLIKQLMLGGDQIEYFQREGFIQ
ncbi:MAG: dihydrofolate reductase family protein [Saprospiraceae bacterium]